MTNAPLPLDAIPPAAGPDLFIEAAWTHARSFLSDKGFVPDVMLLGRYADEELLFVFPSGQDRDQFARACEAEAAAFGADIAMMTSEAQFNIGDQAQADVVAVHWRERGQPVRVQFAVLDRSTNGPALGPVSSMPGTQDHSILEGVFGVTRH